MASGVPLGVVSATCAKAGAAMRDGMDRHDQRLRIANERNTVLFMM